MYSGSGAIESWNYTGLLEEDEVKASEQIKFKVTSKTYNGKTVYLNRDHGINGVDTSRNLGYANFTTIELGTLYGKNPNYDTAPLSTLTFTTITAENGKSNLTLLEGNIYHIKMDLEPSKRIYSVNSSNSSVKASVVDSENGFIAVDMPIGGGDSNIDVNIEDKPLRTSGYALEPNPEGISNFEFCVLYNHNIGSSPIFDANPDDTWVNTPKPIYIDGLGSPFGNNFGQGIGGATFDFRKEKAYINANGWNLLKRAFVISYWAKAYESVDNMYVLGNNISGTANKSLHIGWRDANRFTLAFYANDVNWSNPNGLKRADTVDKWFHYAIAHDSVGRKSKLFINGQLAGELTHSNGQYQSYINMIVGTQNAVRTKTRLSNLRIMIGKYNQGGYLLTDNKIQNIYTQEKKVLEDVR
jgi:hypothetical protein